MAEKTTIKEQLREAARSVGFELVGFTGSAAPDLAVQRYRSWLERGYHGSMAYLAREPARREDPCALFSVAKTAMVFGMLYGGEEPFSVDVPEEPGRGWISRYAWGDDYHHLLWRLLDQVAEKARALLGSEAVSRGYVDSAPILEKALGEAAGLGWIGKNTCLINSRVGSYFFLGELLLDAELEPDTPAADHCGTCTRCMDACPTGALVAPYVLDARKCISYLTIESRDTTPQELADELGRHIFGCDICQDVCPWTVSAPRIGRSEFSPRPGLFAPSLSDVLSMDQMSYQSRFQKSAIKRTKLTGLQRNACVAAANTNDKSSRSLIQSLTKNETQVVAGQARRALKKLTNSEG